MIHKTKIRVKIGFVLIAILLSCFTGTASASQDSESKTIRVAFPDQRGMSEIGESGDLSGYNYEYLQILSEYTGWNYEFITYDGMSSDEAIMSAMEMVQSGEADLMGPILKNESTESLFEFPEHNYGNVYTCLSVLETSDITQTNYMSLQPLRVAVLDNATQRNQETKDYLNELGIQVEYIECASTDEQYEKLKAGEVDALTSITLSYFAGTRNIAEYAARNYYFVTSKGNTEILDEMDQALEDIALTRPYLERKLQETYFGAVAASYDLTEDENLTEDEKQIFQKKEKLKVLCMPGAAPFVYEEEGEAKH